ncbi:MAG: TIGR04086 family membrane protein [Acidimicrobiia bacterium]|nr:TIGR04086 family membrane protein [Acidimicrobiia bacterium]
MRLDVSWGAVALGAMTGLGVALAVFLFLGVTGILTEDNAAIPVAFLQFLAQFGAGYVSGRLAGRDGVIHGSFAAIAMYLLGSTLTLAAAPDTVGTGALILFAVVAAVLGSAGGLLADSARRAESE